ncbi:hypothetical protein BC937DRAFT_87651, partial [Endogone sp. FLAS-F59071]
QPSSGPWKPDEFTSVFIVYPIMMAFLECLSDYKDLYTLQQVCKAVRSVLYENKHTAIKRYLPHYSSSNAPGLDLSFHDIMLYHNRLSITSSYFGQDVPTTTIILERQRRATAVYNKVAFLNRDPTRACFVHIYLIELVGGYSAQRKYDFDDQDIPRVTKHVAAQPWFALLRRGDVIHNGFFGSFRNQGKVIFDGQNVVRLAYHIDEYGSLPPGFDCALFPKGYWVDAIAHNGIVFLDLTPYLDEIRKNAVVKTISGNVAGVQSYVTIDTPVHKARYELVAFKDIGYETVADLLNNTQGFRSYEYEQLTGTYWDAEQEEYLHEPRDTLRYLDYVIK